MESVVLILYVVVSIFLVLAIILQPGKGGGMGALGGGGGGGGGGGAAGMFGAKGAVPFLSKLTVYLSIGFGVLVLILARMNIDRTTIDVAPKAVPASSAPLVPGDGAAAPADGGAEAVPTEAAAE